MHSPTGMIMACAMMVEAFTESIALLLLPMARLLLILMASAVDTATGSTNAITLTMLAIWCAAVYELPRWAVAYPKK